jgi:hypothetical protein
MVAKGWLLSGSSPACSGDTRLSQINATIQTWPDVSS